MPVQIGSRWLHNIIFYDVILKADPFKPHNAFMLGWAFVMYKTLVRASSTLLRIRATAPHRPSQSLSHPRMLLLLSLKGKWATGV
jgi:hypothetical protein